MKAADAEPSSLRGSVKVLLDTSSTVEQIAAALDDLELIVRMYELGNDFVVLGGMDPLVLLLSHPVPELRMKAATVLGASLQSNIKAQSYCHEKLGLTPTLFEALEKETDSLAKKRMLFAFSCLTRGYPEATKVSFVLFFSFLSHAAE